MSFKLSRLISLDKSFVFEAEEEFTPEKRRFLLLLLLLWFLFASTLSVVLNSNRFTFSCLLSSFFLIKLNLLLFCSLLSVFPRRSLLLETVEIGWTVFIFGWTCFFAVFFDFFFSFSSSSSSSSSKSFLSFPSPL